MSRKTIAVLVGALAVVVALAGVIPVLAQSPNEGTSIAGPGNMGASARGRGMIGQPQGRRPGGPGGQEAIAEALGMDVEDVAAQLRAGKSLADLAEEKGVDLQVLKDAVDAARIEGASAAIERAVENGNLTREKADWMLRGLENGFSERGGLPGRGGFGPAKTGDQPGLEAAAELLGLSVDELSLQRWGGRTLADLAERQNVDLGDLQAALGSARKAAAQEAIEQAVQDGVISRGRADWALEGLENGYGPGNRFPRMGGPGGRGRSPRMGGPEGPSRPARGEEPVAATAA